MMETRAVKTYPADLIADYFLSRTNPDEGDLISNLKLQKLCYYGAGLMAAMRNDDRHPLFNDSIEAWQHGPVVPTQYRRFKVHGAGALPIPEVDIDALDAKDRTVLDDVYNFFGQFSAWKLRNMTHEEQPWQNAVGRNDKTIHTSALREFFSQEFDAEYLASYHAA